MSKEHRERRREQGDLPPVRLPDRAPVQPVRLRRRARGLDLLGFGFGRRQQHALGHPVLEREAYGRRHVGARVALDQELEAQRLFRVQPVLRRVEQETALDHVRRVLGVVER